ncbi:amidohydrolase [Pseudalkalibacillus berkeleyi]|uniref:Amidohydrolase n=1 Tax=Pseudalkalibacillus berkeleyi TaxID=1069813 RepID=A0ABS9H312_9BACL|nr:amidohydrolase [Pseudalkalibacillus berkeleyi]MCF6138232.1 amidohydrolase [Pseudalkalibacillus berkeleyi]
MKTLWTNGTIYTMNEEFETVEAVIVENERIIDTGDRDRMEREHAIDEIQDLQGAVMYPGFVDSHLHMIGHGEKLLRLDLSEIHSAEEMRTTLKEKVYSTPFDEWIIGDGWNENNFVDRKIFHRNELDEIAPHHPMMLTRICRHALLANSKALDIAGITKHTPDPPGGVIVRDSNGSPTGYLLDKAQDLVRDALPKVTEEYLHRALSTSVEDLTKHGLVGGHSEDLNYYGGFKRTYDTFLNVVNEENMKFKANLLVHHEVVEDMHEHRFAFGASNGYVELGAMKIFADGALGGRTAYLSKPYNDMPETYGVAIHTLTELKNLVKKARRYNMPVAIHTIGDLALEFALYAVEEYPPPIGLRDRFVHGQVVRPDLIERLKKVPVIIDIQPHFVASDFPWVIERLGEERMQYSFAWKTLLDEGIPCGAGSDAPIETADPLATIYAAVMRKKKGDPHQGYYPEQKLTVYEAVSLYTKGSAYAIGKEDEMGRIKSGYSADFTVLSEDLFRIDPENIPDVTVLKTVVNNSIVYAAE